MPCSTALSGDDSGSFKVDNNGQIRTESEAGLRDQGSPTWWLLNCHRPLGSQQTPSSWPSTVTDEDDDAAIELNVAPAYADDSADRSVAENSEAGTAIGDPVTAY